MGKDERETQEGDPTQQDPRPFSEYTIAEIAEKTGGIVLRAMLGSTVEYQKSGARIFYETMSNPILIMDHDPSGSVERQKVLISLYDPYVVEDESGLSLMQPLIHPVEEIVAPWVRLDRLNGISVNAGAYVDLPEAMRKAARLTTERLRLTHPHRIQRLPAEGTY